MADNQKQAADFFKAMGEVVSNNRRELTSDKGVAGTDMGMLELMRLKSAYNRFEETCVPQLAAGNSCTTVFNTTGGKRLDVEVSLTQGVEIHITNPEANNAKRKVNFKPVVPGATQ